jgi:tetratricopeptide (TPR) repeat protein
VTLKMAFGRIWLWGFCLISTLAVNCVSGAETPKGADAFDGWSTVLEMQTLIDGKKIDDVTPVVKRLAKTTEGAIWSELILVRVQISDKGTAKALVPSEKFGKAYAALGVKASSDLSLAWAETLRRLARLDDAAAIANTIGNSGSGLTRARAAEIIARIHMERGNSDDALSTIDMGLGGIKPPDKTSGSSGSEDIAAADRQRLGLLRDQIVATQDLVKHGLGFKLYRDANEQRLKRNHEAALKGWDELLAVAKRNAGKPIIVPTSLEDPRIKDLPIIPVYAAAAQYYRGVALFHLMRWDDARQAAQSVLADPAQPWQAEAEQLLGDVAYEGDMNPQKALEHYTAAVKRSRDDAQIALARSTYAIPDASLVRTAPAKGLREKDMLGQLATWSIEKPEQIINHQTATYYTKRLMLNAFLGQMSCYFSMGDKELAQQTLGLYAAIDPEYQGDADSGLPTAVKRLRDGIRLGHFGARDEEMGEFSGQMRVRLVRAEIYSEAARYVDGLACYERICADKRLKTDMTQQAYLDYARAICATYLEDDALVKTLTVGFDGPKAKYRKTYTYWRAQFLMADRWANRTSELLQRGAAECDDPSMRMSFCMVLGQNAFGVGDNVTAAKWFNQLIKMGSDNDYRVKAAKQALELILSDAQKNKQ